MVNIAVADDDLRQQKLLKEYLDNYSEESLQQINVQFFSDGFQLLENYVPGKFDILLLDIQMQNIDGMKAAQEIRMIDDTVIIMFITNFVHYAIRGYSVKALDFIVKPISYELFCQKLKNAVLLLNRNQKDKIYFKTKEGHIALDCTVILYFEVSAHKVIIHTNKDSHLTSYTLKNIEEKLNDARFFRCHTGFLVNILHVKSVGKNFAVMGNGTEVPISKYRRKEFLDAIGNCLGREI